MHPLDPLSSDEITTTVELLRGAAVVGDTYRFASITLVEPPKAQMLAWRPGDEVTRRSLSVFWDRRDNLAREAIVDLVAGSIESVTEMPGVTPNFTVDEWHDCEHAMKDDPRVVQALAERGITDLSLVVIDVWTYGKALMPPQWADRRLGWADIWVRSTPYGNPYANPVSGIKLIVDMNTMELLEIDRDDTTDPAPVMGEYEPDLVPGQVLRDDVKALHITQPDGPGFTIDGNELRWQNWKLRVGFNYREGLVLHQVSYDDHGTERDIAYRMSLAEMIVPYRDSGFDHYRRTAYDIGEWGLGYMTTSLQLGCDCLGEIRYLDATLADSAGIPYDIKQAICIHEEDNAVLWKHVDNNGRSQVRRMRRLVVSAHATVANYEYLIYWRFYTDGNIECEIRATGIMVTTPLAPGQPTPATGTLVDQRTYAPFHQHILVARLDLDVDGPQNSVMEVDSFAVETSPDNPYGLAIQTRATLIASESEAGRDYDFGKQRSWKVTNPNRPNGLGTPVAYKLLPGAAIPSLMAAGAPQYRRAPVIGHTLWVTKQHDDEKWPCGDYPTQSETDDGMTRWIADDESLENTDVVLWYVFGIHHITRPEDWPVMPADTVSFWLKPFGFFDRNPSLDVPPTPAADHCH
ncbi:primary-amine oxidase [Nakamurella panacisegetis]|uniref:Amine oxidase n=1 Tax=Nakamurella panacisegetis TaxID=1090615 RepID=A0A1H0INA0_9ACTN|nr:primary-amine oxidase [Nakamurella panacisegetis]SDO32863.1 primary-amine oxidase [Nakamurella panacisegetis]